MKILVTGGSGFIGTNLIEALKDRHTLLDLSLTAPVNPAHLPFWKPVDILNATALRRHFHEFQPEVVIHLAGRTDCDENTTVEEGYRANTDGTSHVLDAIRDTPSLRRVIITSSQFVCGPERLPVDDLDYFPHTIYGQSKVITEERTRAARLPCCWTFIRPTNIWGPWHGRYPNEFWKIVAKGLYFHPAGKPVVRCYGYVGNVVNQIEKIFTAQENDVHEQTFYVGDPADDIYKWANGFSLALTGRPARRVPRPLLYSAGLAGDLITSLTHKNFYITTSRYRSMITDYVTPMQKSLQFFGPGPYTLEEGIEETVQWLREKRKPFPGN